MRRTSSVSLPKPGAIRFGLTPVQRGRAASILSLSLLFLAMPALANASPFDGMITNVETLFTGPIATAGCVIALVISGIAFATGDAGAKRNVAGVVFGVAMAIGAVNVLSWLTA